MLVCGVVIALWLVGLFVQPTSPMLSIPMYAGILSVATIISGAISLGFRDHHRLPMLTMVTYLLLLATTLCIIFGTGNASSPFIALWMLVSVFGGLFGLKALVPAMIVATIYFAYLYVAEHLDNDQIVIFALAFELPLIISYLIWHKRADHENSKEVAYSALAKELSQVANKSEIVINAIADGVIAIDGKGIIQLINPAAQIIIGWGKQDAIGLDYRSVLKLQDAKDEAVNAVTDPVQQGLKTNQTVMTDKLSLATMAGKKLLVSVLVSPVGSLGAGSIIVFRDITSQREEERQQVEFISTASHEMRTPVASIEGYLGLALNPQTAAIDDKARLYLTKAHESAQHLGRLFQDLLDISKAEDGRLKNTPSVIDIIGTTRDIVQGFLPSATAKGLALAFEPDIQERTGERITPVYYSFVDADHLREVVGNLIENAIKYSRKGSVSVDISGDENHVRISIKDTGIGIPAEDIPHLFQKFYRVDNTDTREIGGTGLGLYLSRRLTEAMSGRLDVTSEYGKGSTFTVELERMRQDEAMRMITAADAMSAKNETAAQQKPQAV